MAKLSELADHLGISTTRISQLVTAGILPPAPRGKQDLDISRTAYLEHLREVAAGRAAQDGAGLDIVAERARLAAAQADDREMKNDLARGEQITVAEFHTMMTTAFARVRSKLLAMPSKLAPMMVSVKTTGEAQAQIKRVVYDTLNELAGTTAAEESEDEEQIKGCQKRSQK